jgi:hypothetical protein
MIGSPSFALQAAHFAMTDFSFEQSIGEAHAFLTFGLATGKSPLWL